MSERIEVINLKCNMQDPQGKLIPRGVTEMLSVQIADEVATFWFKDARTTEKFAKVAIALDKEQGKNNTIWMDRVKKAVTKYEGKSKEEIRDIILDQLKKMGAVAKEHGRR